MIDLFHGIILVRIYQVGSQALIVADLSYLNVWKLIPSQINLHPEHIVFFDVPYFRISDK